MTIIMVDSVLLSAITALDIDVSAWLAQFRDSPIKKGVRDRPILEMKQSYERAVDLFDVLALSETIITETATHPVMTTNRLLLGEGIAYRSTLEHEDASEVHGWKFPERDAKTAHVRLTRGRLPETALIGLVGEHIARVVAHPFLMHADMVIDRIDPGMDGNVPTIEIGMRQVLVPLTVPQ